MSASTGRRSRASTLRASSPAEIAARAAKRPVRGLIPRPVQPVVERATAIGELHGLIPLALVGHDVREVVASSALADRHRWSRRRARRPRRCDREQARDDRSTLRSTPRAEGRGPGLVSAAASPAASSAAKILCAPLLSPRTTHAQPNPLTMSSASRRSCSAVQANAASMLARSVRAKERCSAWSAAAHTFGRGSSRVREPSRVRSEGALGQPSVGHLFERECTDAVEQPVPNGPSTRSSSSTMTRERLASLPTTSIAADAGTPIASRTNSTAGSGAPPANVARAHRPRLSSGNNSS